MAIFDDLEIWKDHCCDWVQDIVARILCPNIVLISSLLGFEVSFVCSFDHH